MLQKVDNAHMPLLTDSFEVFRLLITTVLKSIQEHYRSENNTYHHQCYLSLMLPSPYAGSLRTVSSEEANNSENDENLLNVDNMALVH